MLALRWGGLVHAAAQPPTAAHGAQVGGRARERPKSSKCGPNSITVVPESANFGRESAELGPHRGKFVPPASAEL